jgi:hypothetical protein
MSAVDILPEAARWRARAVKYYAGDWRDLSAIVPKFELADFKAAPDEPVNPFLRTVVRLPVNPSERPIPVGIVSNSYALVQHAHVADLCLSALTDAGIDVSQARCELGFSELGEWMNFRVYLPDEFAFLPEDGHQMRLRLEAFNSVDRSSRLTVLMNWFRLVCSNGLIVRKSVQESDVHDSDLNLVKIKEAIVVGVREALQDRRRLIAWQSDKVEEAGIKSWADGALTEKWGKRAACRVFHICQSGRDAEFIDPFEGGPASEKSIRLLAPVAGARAPARSRFDVSQALSYVATQRTNAESRTEWQAEIAALIGRLAPQIRTA